MTPDDGSKGNRNHSPDPAQLRSRAEEMLRTLEDSGGGTLSFEETARVLHELRVQQVELEMQNEALREAQEALDASRARYLDLYDLAPVGYCTLSRKGIILQANLTAATLLGTGRDALTRWPLSRFIQKEDQQSYLLCMKRLFDTNLRQVCELRVLRQNSEPFWVRLESVVSEGDDHAPVCRMVISDVTKRKLAENALRESEHRLRGLSAKLLSAQEEERKKIAAELHDSLGSSLSGIKIGIENVRDGLERGQTKSEMLDAPLAWTRLAIDELRRLMARLRPPVIDDMGVIAALQWFFRQYRMTYPKIRVEVEVGIEERDIPEALRIVIFRIAQEAFHNIAKHSGAEYVDFSLMRRNGALTLVIEDNGKGFDLQAVFPKTGWEKRFGLTGMKERAELSGGSFTLRSAPGNGTEVSAQWPLEAPAATN